MDHDHETPPPPPLYRPAGRQRRQPGSGAVALVLAAAAVAAAIVGAFASIISNDAANSWQSALRTEVKRSAAALNDVSYLYLFELPGAARVVSARLAADALSGAGAGQGREVAQALETEAAVQAQIVDLLSASTPLTETSAYLLPSGGLDVGRRLADIRAGGPEGPELPESLVAAGDRLGRKASLLTFALIPISLSALLGILAQPLRRCRARLLLGGLAALAGGSLMALIVGVAS
ncbi:MAG: hypothetical protein H6Q11_1445 [Acidobacteria bacterium]|nr:hypothetical protein [Acidobacteriota bacterium]